MTTDSMKVVPGTPEWEQLCERCGRCCYEKIEYDGLIYYTDRPCPHLDTEQLSCRIYALRSELHPECAQLTPDLVAAGFLPVDCPYVKRLCRGQDNQEEDG